jgi:hypothetical protein
MGLDRDKIRKVARYEQMFLNRFSNRRRDSSQANWR